MTADTIEVPDFVTMVEPEPGKTLYDLAEVLAEMTHPDYGLPQPAHVSISAIGQEIRLQFSGDPATFHAMALWTERFGGTVTGSNDTIGDGEPCVRCEVKFTFKSVHVVAYAYVRTTSSR